jgi:hypothetical protein
VLHREAARSLVPVSKLAHSLSGTGLLPIALSEVLGLSLLEVLRRYFNGASKDKVAHRIGSDID